MLGTNQDVINISNSDPHTLETKLQVQKIINFRHIINNTPDAFSDYKGVTKSYNSTRNMLERVEVLNKLPWMQLPAKYKMQLLPSKGQGRTNLLTQ